MSRAMLRSLAVLLLLLPATASASWHIGPNFGLTYHSPGHGGDGTTLLSWGSSSWSWFLGTWQPGMRVGFDVGAGADELYVDSGFEFISSQGSSAHLLQASLNYQHGFSRPRTDGVYLTAGAGLFRIGADHEGATVPEAGGGIGFQHFFIEGHGRFRTELRYDRTGEDVSFGLPAANAVTAKLGFDLIH